MPVVSSQYWNMAYGQTPGQAEQDEEGMQTMRTLGRNMAWLILYPLTKKEKTQKNQHFWYLFIFYSVILCKFAAIYLITDRKNILN